MRAAGEKRCARSSNTAVQLQTIAVRGAASAGGVRRRRADGAGEDHVTYGERLTRWNERGENMLQRLIAQGVLWAMLTGMAPLAPAATMRHACCLRRQQRFHTPHDAGITNPSCGHQCCRLLAVSSALFAPAAPAAAQILPVFPLLTSQGSAWYGFLSSGERSERGPPLSI